MKKSFSQNIQEIRRRARQHIEQGAVTENFKGDPELSVKILNEALATEMVCVLRYKYHFFMADGLQSEAIKEEFLQHAREEQDHADLICERIAELGGKPDLNPETLVGRSHSDYQEGENLVDMIREDLIAERIAIDSYREMVHYFTNADPTSRRLMERILAKEEEHAHDMSSLLVAIERQAARLKAV